MTKAAAPVVVAFGEQEVHPIDPRRVELAQRLAGEITAGIQVSQFTVARLFGCWRPTEMRLPIGIQLGPATGIAGVEQKVFEIDRDKLAGIAQLVRVEAARHLSVALLTLAITADILRPASQIQQTWVVGEAKAPRRLPATAIGQA